ncbi:DUF2799 domain-containing protein [Vibrio intestinalis]|uniref:DUF2799 domain-containing protein n=1 Tax=Vibrio intestinalis TaxID=2933291 RepID=UPI0021A6F560|nr:DUF2799 domain-containing protein [Vibrio intestinalis]
MKYTLMLLTALLVGCSAQPLPALQSESDWLAYGKQRAMDGYIVQTEDKLAKLDAQSAINDDFYQAYLQGYEQGKQTYCDQSAYMLGRLGRAYRGICDDQDPFFRQDYYNGRRDLW